MARTVFSIFSFLASSLSFFSRPSSSLRKTTKLPMRASLFLAVAASIFLTKLVKGPVISRAKIIATGFPPFFQTRQSFEPSSGPVACNGLKGVIRLEPTWGPDLRPPAARALPASSAAAREAPSATRRFITNQPPYGNGGRIGDSTVGPYRTVYGSGRTGDRGYSIFGPP